MSAKIRDRYVEDVEWLLHSGESPERILARLGTTAGGLAQAMHREGRDDLAKPFRRIDFKGRRANRTIHTRKDTTA